MIITNLLSVLCILIETLSRVHTKGKKDLNDLKFGTFIGRFPRDGAACMAVKGLSTTVDLNSLDTVHRLQKMPASNDTFNRVMATTETARDSLSLSLEL